jgi:hypothetical protein
MKYTILDLIRRDGYEPGGRRPLRFSVTIGLAVRSPRKLKRIRGTTLLDIAKQIWKSAIPCFQCWDGYRLNALKGSLCRVA